GGRHGVPLGVGVARAPQLAGEALVHRTAVADQAGVALARELRPFRLLLVQRVEDRAELRVDGRHFEDDAVPAKADVGVIAEVHGPRRRRLDALALEARLGEDQRLRGDRHVQLAQQRAQVADLVVVVQAALPRAEALLQPGAGVAPRGRAVLDRLTLNVCAPRRRTG